jgi:hypothetical protein
VTLGVAAVEAAASDPAAPRAEQALDQLEVTWYATGIDRITSVKRLARVLSAALG